MTFTLQECKLLVVVGVADLDGVLGAQTIFVGPLGREVVKIVLDLCLNHRNEKAKCVDHYVVM